MAMHLLHDVLRAAYPLLPEPFQTTHARLFTEEEHLNSLARRLMLFARQGVPAEMPQPHFSAECTPPLSQAFAPFRPVVVAWHEAPDSLDLPERMAQALVEAGCSNILILLGQRCTPASLTDARAIPPSRAKLIGSATQLHLPDDHLTVGGRALAKHAARNAGTFWGEVTGTPAEKNALALRHIETILEGVTWWNVFGHFQHETVFEARLPSGHGARWGKGGETFIGFLEPFDETRGAAGERQPGEASNAE